MGFYDKNEKQILKYYEPFDVKSGNFLVDRIELLLLTVVVCGIKHAPGNLSPVGRVDALRQALIHRRAVHHDCVVQRMRVWIHLLQTTNIDVRHHRRYHRRQTWNSSARIYRHRAHARTSINKRACTLYKKRKHDLRTRTTASRSWMAAWRCSAWRQPWSFGMFRHPPRVLKCPVDLQCTHNHTTDHEAMCD